jgi:hypothetical protein
MGLGFLNTADADLLTIHLGYLHGYTSCFLRLQYGARVATFFVHFLHSLEDLTFIWPLFFWDRALVSAYGGIWHLDYFSLQYPFASPQLTQNRAWGIICISIACILEELCVTLSGVHVHCSRDSSILHRNHNIVTTFISFSTLSTSSNFPFPPSLRLRHPTSRPQ